MNNDIIEIIRQVAQIPSFSSYEERIHPFINDFIQKNQINGEIYSHFNNLIIEVNKNDKPAIAFTAHLDKIDHYDEEIEELAFEINNDKIKGQLDDAVGVGICLYLLKKSNELNLPHSLFLFSEMEESNGLQNNRNALKNCGNDLYPQIGAVRISEFLIEKSIIPSVIMTIDTTPLFYGEPGVALYSKFWEILKIDPVPELVEKTMAIEKIIQDIYPEIKLANNNNDYVKYGKIFAENQLFVPSIALEPSIYPYHEIGEEVFISDVEKTLKIIIEFIDRCSRF